MKKVSLALIFILAFVFGAFFNQQSASAGIFDTFIKWLPTPDSSSPAPATGDGAQSGCTFNGQGEEICSLENPIGETEVPALIKQVITVALSLIGAFTLLMLVWGGFQWLTSAGNPEKVSAGTQTMVWAVIGVMVVLSSYLLLSTFLDFLTR